MVQCLKYGLKPLAVTYKTPGRNYYGEINLKSLIYLGVEHIDYTINPKVEAYFMIKALKKKDQQQYQCIFQYLIYPK